MNGFSANLSQIAGHTGADFWAGARAQRRQGHYFNATLLYTAAASTLDRGPYLQTAAWANFQKDYQTFVPTTELKGPGPYVWTLGGKVFPVSSVSFTGMDDQKMVLFIYQPSTVWSGDVDADRRNHELIDAFIKAHPEWTEAFDAIVVRAIKPNSDTGYGTVYQKGTGYA